MMWFTAPLFCNAGEWEKSKYEHQHQQKQDEASLESRQLLPFLWADKQQNRADSHNKKSSVGIPPRLPPGLLKAIQLYLIPPSRAWWTSCLTHPVWTQHVRYFSWWMAPCSCSKIKTPSNSNQQLGGSRRTEGLSRERRQTGGPVEDLLHALINAGATPWNRWEINWDEAHRGCTHLT